MQQIWMHFHDCIIKETMYTHADIFTGRLVHVNLDARFLSGWQNILQIFYSFKTNLYMSI